MILKKFQLLVSNNKSPTQEAGGVMVLDGKGEVVVSSKYLHKNSSERYFLKSNEPSSEPIEISVIEEITSGDWRQDPPPHVYRIRLA